MPEWLKLLFGGTFLTVIGSLLGWRVRRRRTEAESVLDEAQAGAVEDEAARKLRSEVRELWQRVGDVETRERDCQDTLTVVRREVASIRMAALRSDVASLKRGDPATLAADIIADIPSDQGLCGVLDESRDAFIISTPEDGGTIVWCNLQFATELLMARERVLELGWKGLVHGDDLRTTQSTEGSAHGPPRKDFVNRWRRSDGRYIQRRWAFTSYGERRSTLALAHFEGVT